MKRRLQWWLVVCSLLTACTGSVAESPRSNAANESSILTPTPVAVKKIPLAAGYGWEGDLLEVYFTNPTSALASQETGGLDGVLVKAIEGAQLSLDLAIYNLNLGSLRDALIEAQRRGVRVRVVMESENMEKAAAVRLREAKIPMVGDGEAGLMHDKFMVIDHAEVWTGSLNYTASGIYEDNNNLLRVRSPEVAENFSQEFEEMYADGKFGADSVAGVPQPSVTLDEMSVETYFSPDDGVQSVIEQALQSAQESVRFLAFSFTSDPLAEVMVAQAEAGVDVAGVMDEGQVKSNTGSKFETFQKAGMNVLLDGNAGQMHHKVMVIDESVVVVGSYNFTHSAETKNDEVMLVIRSPEIAKLFLGEFERVYREAGGASEPTWR